MDFVVAKKDHQRNRSVWEDRQRYSITQLAVSRDLAMIRRAIEIYGDDGLTGLAKGADRFVRYRQKRLKIALARFSGRHSHWVPVSTELSKPVFVIGSPRSGTSIFVRCLGHHPYVAEWSEAGDVWDTEYYAEENDHVLEAADVTEEDRERIRATFSAYVGLSRGDRFLNKHPRNSLRIGYIREIFPDAVFVHMVRHPVGSIDSMVRRSLEGDRHEDPYGRFVKPPGWKEDLDKDDLVKFARSWTKVNKYVLDRYDDRFQTVTYEGFCESPVGTLNKISEAVDLDPTFDSIPIPSDITDENEKSFERFSKEELITLWDIVEAPATELGYSEPV